MILEAVLTKSGNLDSIFEKGLQFSGFMVCVLINRQLTRMSEHSKCTLELTFQQWAFFYNRTRLPWVALIQSLSSQFSPFACLLHPQNPLPNPKPCHSLMCNIRTPLFKSCTVWLDPPSGMYSIWHYALHPLHHLAPNLPHARKQHSGPHPPTWTLCYL